MAGMMLQPGSAVSILALGMLLEGAPALAQETVPTEETQGPRANGTEGKVEDIVVTARRQAESLQKTPVAVTALSQETIDRLNINQPDRLSNLAPNLAITQQTASTTASSIYIRGIGEQNPILTSESGVGLYLDGVYLARTSGAIFDLVDLERIEVLRGPQGTLFGRNTTGGAVQLVSRAPSSTFQGRVKAGYGSFNDWYAQAQVDTRLAPFMRGTVKQFLGWTNAFAATPNQIHPLDPSFLAAAQGDAGTLYHNGYFDLPDAETGLEVRFTPPSCRYWNLQGTSHWLESFDPVGAAVNLNNVTATVESDGSIRAIFALSDPGIPNWIDTAGHLRGCIALRVIGADSGAQPLTPECKLVALADLRKGTL